MLKSLNTALFRVADIAIMLSRVAETHLISHEVRREAGDQREFLKGIVKEAREQGYNWVWAEDEIEKCEREPEHTVDEWRLGSADIAGYLGISSHNDMEKNYTRMFGKDPDIFWDTEASAVYPKFKNPAAAKRFIKNIDHWFDFALFAIPLPSKKKKK